MDRDFDSNLTRRAFTRNGVLYLLAGLTASAFDVAAGAYAAKSSLRIGYLTDVHYADTGDREGRSYRASLPKVIESVDQLNRQHIDFVVHGGDLVDALPDPDPASERRFLQRIDTELRHITAERHYVLGNHCVFSLTKPEFLETIERPKSYYSFDRDDCHFVILDACYRKDGVDYGRRNFVWTDAEIPTDECNWLEADLRRTRHQTIVFVHQRLDKGAGDGEGVHSSAEVRAILERSGKVIAVFMGHSHVNAYRTINGIHYCTLDAVVGGTGEASNAYSVIEIYPGGHLKLDGFCKHAMNPMTRDAKL